MSTLGSDPSQQPAMSSRQLALIVYILYFVAYFTGITALVGVIIAHIQVGSADPMLSTHYRFQIRTFWIGLLYVVIGTILTFAVVGIRGVVLVVRVVAGAQYQGRARLERKQADREPGLLAVRVNEDARL
jgi:uncharacterized membrane protein